MTRATTSALLGALVVVVGWTAWSTLGLREASESARPAETVVIDAAPPAAGPPHATPHPVEPMSAVLASTAPTAPVPQASAAPPPLRDGLVMEHGMPTAVHALASGDGAQAPPPPDVALPAGVRQEDAVVNRAGMVALTRSADTSATGNAATGNAPRTPVATRAP